MEVDCEANDADFPIRKKNFNKCSLSKKTTKIIEEGGPSFCKVIFLSDFRRHVTCPQKSEKGHIEVIPHHHTILGIKEEVQGG